MLLLAWSQTSWPPQKFWTGYVTESAFMRLLMHCKDVWPWASEGGKGSWPPGFSNLTFAINGLVEKCFSRSCGDGKMKFEILPQLSPRWNTLLATPWKNLFEQSVEKSCIASPRKKSFRRPCVWPATKKTWRDSSKPSFYRIWT